LLGLETIKNMVIYSLAVLIRYFIPNLLVWYECKYLLVAGSHSLLVEISLWGKNLDRALS